MDVDAGRFVAEIVASQIDLHQEYGGVVPDLASRAHLDNFAHIFEKLKSEHPSVLHEITSVAVTRGPGLAGCLALGLGFAHALAFALDVPVFGVNHLRGHLYSPFIPTWLTDSDSWRVEFGGLLPHLGLIVSGGNTILALIDRNQKVSILAETVDDAAGEALDKGAKLLGMPYPGGPHIERIAAKGDPAWHVFPLAAKSKNDRRFSFSGLKTSLRYFLEKTPDAEIEEHLPDICASYQSAVVRQLSLKTEHMFRAQVPGGIKSLSLSGGVSNNQALRDSMQSLADRMNCPLLLANRHHVGDNAAMIAFAAFVDTKETTKGPLGSISFAPTWSLVP